MLVFDPEIAVVKNLVRSTFLDAFAYFIFVPMSRLGHRTTLQFIQKFPPQNFCRRIILLLIPCSRSLQGTFVARPHGPFGKGSLGPRTEQGAPTGFEIRLCL